MTQKQRLTPETDAAHSAARIGYQAMPDENWPWSAINEGWNAARNMERQRDELLEVLKIALPRIVCRIAPEDLHARKVVETAIASVKGEKQ